MAQPQKHAPDTRPKPVRFKGTVRKLLIDFGFIRHLDTGIDYFFHERSVADGKFRSLHIEQYVEFTPEDGPKGPRAVDVTLSEYDG